LPFEAFWILAAAAGTLGCAHASGRLLAAGLRVSLPWPVQLLAGAGLLSVAALGVGLAGGANAWALAALGLLVMAAAAMVRMPAPPVRPRTRWLWWWLAPFVVVYLVHAMAPEISPDGLAYHVALPLRYLREGCVGTVPFNMYGQLSQGMEMLYLFALPWGGRSAAAVVHLGFLAALTAMIWDYGRRVVGRAGAGAACVLVFCAPVVGIDAASAYTDVAAAAVLFALYVVLTRVAEEPRLALVAGVLAGFGYGIKYTAGVGVVIGFVWLFRGRAASLGLFATGAAGMILPWLAKNWAFTGNPLAPFANAWFPNAVFDAALESAYVKSLRWYSGLGGWTDLVAEISTRGVVLNGLLGPVWLVAPLVILAWRWPEARRLTLVGLLVALPFAGNTGTRFLIPALPFVALALAHLPRRMVLTMGALHFLLSWPWVAGYYAHPYAWRIQEFPWRAALRLEPAGAFEARRLRESAMAELMNRSVPPGERVLTQTQFTDALTHAEMVTGPLSRPAVEMRRMVYGTASAKSRPGARLRFWFRTGRYERIRVRQRAGEGPAALAECQVYRLMTPLEMVRRGPAFDGTTLTRHLLEGPLEIDVNGEADRLECVYDASPGEELVLEARGGSGEWSLAAERAERSVYAEGSEKLPMQAAAILYGRGIRYLLLRDEDYHADLGGLTAEKNMAGWPVERVGSAYGMHLYRLRADQVQDGLREKRIAP
jgi:hypothetical protein